MIPAEIVTKIKRLEIQTKKWVQSSLAGEYQTLFKGQGISFSEVRGYQFGDDAKRIDWRVTARTGDPHIKLHEEERERIVYLLIDVSASGSFGSRSKSKRDLSAEVAAMLGFSALANQDRVGLILFSDRIERIVPPRKGRKHMLRVLSEIFTNQAEGKKTSIAHALQVFMTMQKKRAVVFLISDFIDTDYEKVSLKVAERHELIPVVVEDPKELTLPKSGLVLVQDAESGEEVVINTFSADVRRRFKNIVLARRMERERLFRKMKVRPVQLMTDKPAYEPLDGYFKRRIKERR